jgi:PAS domain S-box-containing protein
MEHRVVKKSTGEVRIVHERCQHFRDESGRIIRSVGMVHDITERKKAEAALHATEEEFRRAIEEAPIPVIMHAEDGQVLQISSAWTELTGYTAAHMPTFEAWLNSAYGEGADEVREHVHELFKGTRRSINIEFPIRTRDGRMRHWSFSASAPGTLADGRRFVVGMAVDITERMRTKEERQRLLAKFSTNATGCRRSSTA